jgi:integral membrane protein MviN
MSRKSIFRSSIIVVLLTMIARFSGLFKEIFMAEKFGSGYITDSYVFAFGLTTVMVYCIGEGILTAIIPNLIEYENNQEYEKKMIFVNNVFSIAIVIGLGMSTMGIVLAKPIVYILGNGFYTQYPKEKFIEIINLVRITFTCFTFISIQNVFMGILQSHKKYTTSTINTLIGNIVVIIYIIFFSYYFGVYGLIISNIVGYLFQVLIHLSQLRKLGYKFKFQLNKVICIKIIKLMIPIIIGRSFNEISSTVDRAIASSTMIGGLSYINYANKINSVFYTLIVYSVVLIIYPYLVEAYTKNIEKFKKLLIDSINIIIFITIPLTTFSIIFKNEIIRILLQRGNFNTNDSKITAYILMIYIISLSAVCVRDVLVKCFYSMKDTKTPMINGTVGVIINIALNIIFNRFFGLNGIPLASTISAYFLIVLLLISLNKRLELKLIYILKEIVKVLIISLIITVILLTIDKYLIFVGFIRLVINFIIFICIYLLLSFIFNVYVFRSIFIKGIVKREQQY